MFIKSSDVVYLELPALYSSSGIGLDPLWQALCAGNARPQPLDGAGKVWPQREAYQIDKLDLSFLGVDRKTLRTMTRQSHLAVYGARLSLAQIDPSAGFDGSRCGLYLGLPTVDEEIPSWSVLESLKTRPHPADLAELFLRETPPFSGLTLLNSSACAHISSAFGLTGTMAAFSPFSDTGLQALIEGALSLVEDENEMALVGAVSPTVNPIRILQYDHLSWRGPQHLGEGAAYMMLRKGLEAEHGVRIAGYGRTFGATETDRAEALSSAISQALAMAEISPSAINWILADSTWTEVNHRMQVHALEICFAGTGRSLALCSAEAVTGVMGPAQPLTHVLLALHGMRRGRRLRRYLDGSIQEEEMTGTQYVLVLACGVYGQLVAVVLQGRYP